VLEYQNFVAILHPTLKITYSQSNREQKSLREKSSLNKHLDPDEKSWPAQHHKVGDYPGLAAFAHCFYYDHDESDKQRLDGSTTACL
jgi:hypothetical protein